MTSAGLSDAGKQVEAVFLYVFRIASIFHFPSSHAATHLLSDRNDACATSAIWFYQQQDWEEKDDWIAELITKVFLKKPQLHRVW